MKVVFAGTPDFSVPCLEVLYNSPEVDLQAVYTQPDRPAGRGKNIQAGAVKRYAEFMHIPIFQPLSFRQDSQPCTAIEQLSLLSPDLLIVIAYGLLLPQQVLDIPRRGCINIHASLLPRWRGAAPIQRAIQAGDQRTGVTLMQMKKALDSGPILATREINIDTTDTGGKLHDKLAKLSSEILKDNLENLYNQSLITRAQNTAAVTYAHRLEKSESILDWNQPATWLQQTVRAFNPWPMAAFNLGDTTIRIHQSSCQNRTTSKSPGEVIHIDKKGIVVQTGEGQLVLSVLQRPGGKAISAADFLNGFNISPGTLLK